MEANEVFVKPTDDAVAYHEHLVTSGENVTTCRLVIADVHTKVGLKITCVCGTEVEVKPLAQGPFEPVGQSPS